jgi:hypothetical protein
MKKLWIIALVVALTACGNTKKADDKAATDSTKVGDKETPAAVTRKFAELYPEVTDVKWEMEDGNYEAEFTIGEDETSVVMDATGKLIETEISIAPTALPEGALHYCSKNMEGKKITEAASIEDASGTITFEAEVDGADYIFDAEGVFIKKIVEEDGQNEDED